MYVKCIWIINKFYVHTWVPFSRYLLYMQIFHNPKVLNCEIVLVPRMSDKGYSTYTEITVISQWASSYRNEVDSLDKSLQLLKTCIKLISCNKGVGEEEDIFRQRGKRERQSQTEKQRTRQREREKKEEEERGEEGRDWMRPRAAERKR